MERKTDSDGTELIGKRFSFNEFNAAIAFEKLNKDGGTSEELYKFDLHVSMCQQFGCNFFTYRFKQTAFESSKCAAVWILLIIQEEECLMQSLSAGEVGTDLPKNKKDVNSKERPIPKDK